MVILHENTNTEIKNEISQTLYSCWILHEKIVYLLISVHFYNYKQMLRIFSVAKIKKF
jgi:hypothetical protein